MQLPIILIVLNCVASLFLVGLIWMVQIVHYPLFAGVGGKQFSAYHQRHQTSITLIVAPPMLIEAASSLLLAWIPPAGVSYWQIFVGIALVFVIWISTAALQVPCHGKLSKGFNDHVHRFLVRSNWIRTVAWTARGGLTTWMLVSALAAA